MDKRFKKTTMYVAPLLMSLSVSLVYGHGEVKDAVYKEVPVTKHVSMLQGKGGNIGLIKGEDGLLLIDDGYKANVAALEQMLDKDIKGKPKYVINTHWHGDHTGGNEHLGEYVTIVAHENVRKRLGSPQEIKAFGMKFDANPKSALPALTFSQSLSLYANNQEVSVVHFPMGHTDGDSVVFIQPDNVVHMGDHFFSGKFPFVDLGSGGSVVGMANNVGAIIEHVKPDVKIIPGHGPLSNLDDLKEYHQMLVGTTAVVQQFIDDGLTVKEVQKAGLPDRWKAWGTGFISEKFWLKTVYDSLKSGPKE